MKRFEERYSARGLTIVLFPCGQFGGQELAKDADILKFVADKGLTKARVAAKGDIQGANANSAWRALKESSGDVSDTRWNFSTKFLVSRDGVVERREEGADALEERIVQLLDA